MVGHGTFSSSTEYHYSRHSLSLARGVIVAHDTLTFTVPAHIGAGQPKSNLKFEPRHKFI